jgi:hypothetical protein
MPDHIHFLLSFPRDKPIQTVVSKWKEWTAKTLHIEWQRDFFEHRLRKEESYREKADYIMLNPVRASLVERVEDWPTSLSQIHNGRDIALRCPGSLVGVQRRNTPSACHPSRTPQRSVLWE